MKKNTLIILSCCCFVLSGCITYYSPQYELRGYANAPYQTGPQLYVDQNVMYNMTPDQFNEYKRRLDWAVQYDHRRLQNDAQAAENAVRWTSRSYSETYSHQQQQMNAVSDGMSNLIRRAFNQIQF